MGLSSTVPLQSSSTLLQRSAAPGWTRSSESSQSPSAPENPSPSASRSDVPVSVPGVDDAILDPRETWDDKAAYDDQAAKLVKLFIDNFAPFESHVDQGVKEAAPTAA